jgi:hypothetical protein
MVRHILMHLKKEVARVINGRDAASFFFGCTAMKIK